MSEDTPNRRLSLWVPGSVQCAGKFARDSRDVEPGTRRRGVYSDSPLARSGPIK